MTAVALLDRLSALGVGVTVDGDELVLRPARPLHTRPDLIAELRERKEEVLRLFRGGAVSPADEPHRVDSGWPPESEDYVRRFRCPSARLYPLRGRGVATPDGPGRLLQVMEERCAVVLERAPGRVRFFDWKDLSPRSWERQRLPAPGARSGVSVSVQ